MNMSRQKKSWLTPQKNGSHAADHDHDVADQWSGLLKVGRISNIHLSIVLWWNVGHLFLHCTVFLHHFH